MTLSDEELLCRFEDATLPSDAFHHAEHLRVAWMFVRRYGMPEAMRHFSDALKRFAAAKGRPNLYHQTITWAYLLIIAERLERFPIGTWAEFEQANTDLLHWKPSLLDRYYAPDTLWSDTARKVFVMPDRLLPTER